MAEVLTKIGPGDAGQRMSLDLFAQVAGEPGHVYELAQGVIVVVAVPHCRHGAVVAALNAQLWPYFVAHPHVISYMAGGADACLRLAGMESERHPDMSIYLTPPPDVDNPWEGWTPAIVIEVVSASSVERDYQEKRSEYLAAGVAEYWIVDPAERKVLVLRRRGDVWTEHVSPAGESYTTGLLPEFVLETTKLFTAPEGPGRP